MLCHAHNKSEAKRLACTQAAQMIWCFVDDPESDDVEFTDKKQATRYRDALLELIAELTERGETKDRRTKISVLEAVHRMEHAALDAATPQEPPHAD